ncbi:MAG: hydrolase [Nitrospirae bacterium CG_4_8_14_3_um_filter_70_85]|nr:MAG: hydrolase [Nitrospirae bacterium CG_4_8_14_3_um_filter_70_85]
MAAAGGPHYATGSMGPLHPNRCCLLVIDVQERFLPAIHQLDQVVHNLRGLLRLGRRLGVGVVVTEQYPRGLGATLPAVAAEIDPFVPFPKTHFDACREPGFLPLIHATGATEIIVAGVESHVCVQQTCRALARRGYHLHVVADACASRTPENHAIGLGLMREAAISITSTEAVLMELLGDARGELFKESLAFLKGS